MVSALILGWVVDAAVSSTPQGFFAEHADLLLIFLVFYLVLRPPRFGLSSASNSIIVGPNVMPLVLSRLHRWTLGQAVTFFDNDFAGRIAQKQMQAARAVTDVATEMINTVAFALASIIGSVIFLLVIDVWIAVALAVWLVGLCRPHPLLPAPRAREFGRPRRVPRDGVGAGRGHDHQHQDGQAFRPRRLRGSRRAGRDGGVPRPLAGIRR